ncbi:MAG TPA: hypothetical protein PLX23_02260 [Candidatus Hydrogenedens sp.]|nr:hypothetical protein [Candidatus Hydrogenedens sp.]
MWTTLQIIITILIISQNNEPIVGMPDQPIRNYWEHIQGLLAQSDEIRKTEMTKGKYSLTSNKKYPFDLFRSLTPRELIKAAREGIKAARAEGKAKNWSADEIALKCEENIAYTLEYYGLLIKKPSEIDYLIYCIGADQEEPELRLFLLKQCTPDKISNSLFGIHFQFLLNNRKDIFQKTLFATVKNINEKPEIQIAAIDAFYYFIYKQYQQAVEKDPVFQAYRIEKKEDINPLWIENPQIPKPIEATQIEISKLNQQLKDFTNQLEMKLNNKRQSNDSVIKKAKETIEKINLSLPVPESEKEQLKSLLSADGKIMATE